MTKISYKIKALRHRAGMTQDEFAKALGQKPSKIRDIEAGRQRVNDQFVTNLVEIFPVDLNWLFSSDDSDVDAPPIGPANGNKPFRADVQIKGQDYSTIRLYDVDAAAGNGIIPVTEDTSDQLAFSRTWLLRHGIAADLAGLVRVKGDSMAPTLPDRSLVLVDFRGRADWSVPGVYIIRHEGAIVVKRLQLPTKPRESWAIMISDNPAYPPVFIADASAVDFAPIGRVRAVIAAL